MKNLVIYTNVIGKDIWQWFVELGRNVFMNKGTRSK